jgi:gliding motility-associated lipoprotein GldH
MISNRFFLAVLCLAVFIACSGTKTYDTMLDIEDGKWKEADSMRYEVYIADASKVYNLFYTVRYDAEYPFYNLYIQRTLTDDGGSFLNKKMQGMNLFDPSTGVPYGGGIGSKKDYLIESESGLKFGAAGTYIFTLKQYMRVPELKGLYAVGIRLEEQKASK